MTSCEPRFKKIVLTGGPCAGKSSALAKIVERFSSLGFKVYIVPEMASLLILGGAKPLEMSPGAYYEFQNSMIKCQIAFEDAFEKQARLCGKDVVMICDRGVYDAAGFIDPMIWKSILSENGLNTASARDGRYDAVLHMVTAAKGAEQFYTCENNPAREENLEQARAADDRLIVAWTGHPHLRIFSNDVPSFEEKVNRVIKGISEVLGVPEPIETERKFVVNVVGEPPATAQTFEIVQHYLHKAGDQDEVRIRRRGQNGEWVFTRTVKRPRPDGGPFEIEHLISAGEYFRTLNESSGAKCIQKRRTCFVFADRYYELDDFGAMQVLEIETDEEGELPVPEWMQIVREVSRDTAFRNVNMASSDGIAACA